MTTYCVTKDDDSPRTRRWCLRFGATAALLVVIAWPRASHANPPVSTQGKPSKSRPAPAAPLAVPSPSPAAAQPTPAQSQLTRASDACADFNYVRGRRHAEDALKQGLVGVDQDSATKLIAAASKLIRTVKLTAWPDTATVLVDGRPLEKMVIDPGAAENSAPPKLAAGTASVGLAERLPASTVLVDIDRLTEEAILSGRRHRWTFTAEGHKTFSLNVATDEDLDTEVVVDLCPSEAALQTYHSEVPLREGLAKSNPSLSRYDSDAAYKAACLFRDAMDAKEQKQISRAAALLKDSLEESAKAPVSKAEQRAVTLYELGNCYLELQSYTLARKYYRQATLAGLASKYTRQLPVAEQEIEKHLTRLTVHLAPDDAAMQVDDCPLDVESTAPAKGQDAHPVLVAGTREPGPGKNVGQASFILLLDAGAHKFVVTHPKYRSLETQQVFVHGAARLDIKLVDNSLRVTGYWIGGAGAAALAVSAGLGIYAWQRRDSVEPQCRASGCTDMALNVRQDAGRVATAATVTFVSGLTATAVSGLLMTVPYLAPSFEIGNTRVRTSLSFNAPAGSLMLEGSW